ncbi:MAG TPA: hypothetical protein VG936_18525 [Lacunisphaera sp.]|nr:hypothetical protein [Lacunisphaera sp.]
MNSFRLPAFLAAVAAFGLASASGRTLSLVAEPQLGPPARHGLEKLETAARARGWDVQRVDSVAAATGDEIVAAGLAGARIPGVDLPPVPAAAEALAIRQDKSGGKPRLLVAGHDDRGLMYALLACADDIAAAPDAAHLFSEIKDTTEQPAVLGRELSVYTMNRAHWESRLYDEAYWRRYFDLLAADRFNRFLIIFGYENGGFLAPPYPYFFDTPGFAGVHMVGVTAEQQHRNLAALNRLIELAHERGIDVSLGIWDHIYRAGVQTGGAEWIRDYKGKPVPDTVEGVTTDNLNAYTLASLRELLARVPAVDGLQFRIHEESGLKREEMEGFWRVVFRDVQQTRPGLLVELRGKGTPDAVIDTAVDTGLNFRIETKYWMEQMGLPFHPIHVNPPDQRNRRHGYADFLRYPQRYQMDWRLWNGGTARILLWGDPDYVRRYDATTSLYASPYWDVQEPLATKMEAQKPDMPTFDLMPAKYRYYDYEFERYWHFYQVWGRLGYNPATPADIWDREFRRRFGSAGPDVEAGLHRASQVLPMIVASVYPYSLFPTTRGWAERQALGNTLAAYAKNEGTDTELFENFAQAAARIATGSATAKVTPEQTSRWFDATADDILARVQAAEAAIGAKRGNEFDSTMTDLRILAQLARFHARRSLAAVHYNLFLRDHNPAELAVATAGERAAVAAWRELVAAAGDRYAFDLAMGARNYALCGHWRDELAKLEAGLTTLESEAKGLPAVSTSAPAWVPATSGDRSPPEVTADRLAIAPAGQPLRVIAHVADPSGVRSVKLRYRHVTQYEDYPTLDMQPTGQPGEFAATIPGDFITTEWDLMYFIEAIDGAGNGTMWPDFRRESPYVIVKVQR